ncbi:TetR/AcrR family transcriptional regulator [Nocardia sp. NPDC048505]|uniref:TetR/AcrR family transcriptional regulator n=1 Tax=unclassified Nocardia TaxID=2637762 RepID=UPI0033D0237D
MSRAFTGTYRGTSTAERREDRRRRLLDAALDIIGTQGLAALTVRGLCEQARVGPRFFYEAFPDLDTLAAELLVEIQDSALTRARAAVAGTTGAPADRIRAGVAALITDLTDDPCRAKLIFAQAYENEVLMRARFAGMHRVAEVIVEQARLVLDLPDGQDTALATVSQLISGGAAELVLTWIDGHLPVDRGTLIELLADYAIDMIDRLPAVGARLNPGR